MSTETNKLKEKLKVLLNDPQQQPEALNLVFQLIEKLKQTRISEAWSLANEALSMAQQQKNNQQTANAHLAIADSSWKMAQFSMAVDHYEAALNIYLQLKDEVGIAKCYNGMGIVAGETDELERALECFEQPMRYQNSISDSGWAAVLTGNIGHTNLKLQRFEDAMECFENALKKHTASGNQEGMATMLGGMAGVHVHRQEYDKAIELLTKVREILSSKEPGRGMAVTMMNTGITLLRKGQFNLAKQELEQAHSLMEKIDFKAQQPEVLRHLIHACLELEDTAEFDRYMQIYEEFRHEDIIQQARDRHKRLREFGNTQNRSIEQILD
jgi:tetratricopeptide (TPR) repeat protein